MPIYEYECKKCGFIEEVIQKFSDEPLKKCKKCQGVLEKKISLGSFILKGKGWYTTDYKRKAPLKNASSSEKEKVSCQKKESSSSKTKSTKNTACSQEGSKSCCKSHGKE